MICGICCSLHLTGKSGTRPFLGGSGRKAGAHTHPAFPKIPTALSVFALLGAPQAPGDEAPLEGCKSLGVRPSEAEGNLQVPRHTRPDPAEVLPGNWRGQTDGDLQPGSEISQN